MSRLRSCRRKCGTLTVLGAAALSALVACSGAGPNLTPDPPADSPPAATNGSPPASDGPAPSDAATIAGRLHDATGAVPWPMRDIPQDAVAHPVELDPSGRVTARVDSDGGTLSTTGPDGVQLRLVVPPDALYFATDITVTPITSIAGLEASGATVIGLDIQPHGLQLARLARLEILGADPGEVVGFSYSGTGAGFELAVLDPHPEQVAVYVEHFSGAGVGPFAALSQSLTATTPPARAELASAAAAAHNRQSGGGPDRIAQAFSDLVGAVGRLADTTEAECGASGLSGRLTVLAWLDIRAQFNAADDLDTTSLDALHALTEQLLTCWTKHFSSCVHPSPTQLRALQGIRAALIRYRALDTARQRSGKDSLSELLPCNGSGFVQYRYDDSSGGVSLQISVTLSLKLMRNPDGRGMIASPQSSYDMTYASTKGGDCPATEYGQTSLTLADVGADVEVQPELQLDLTADHPSIWFTPIYYGHWADCHGSGSGWQTLALACDPDDPTGGDSLSGRWGPDRTMFYVACDSQDHKASTTGAVFVTGSLDWLIPAELWD